jgi:hypothetical protein
MNPALFMVVSETVKAWPAFLPPLPKVRHIDPNSSEATDIRLGYALAISWSLVVASYVTSEHPKSNKPILLWLGAASIMTALYEGALRMNPSNDIEGYES